MCNNLNNTIISYARDNTQRYANYIIYTCPAYLEHIEHYHLYRQAIGRAIDQGWVHTQDKSFCMGGSGAWICPSCAKLLNTKS